MKPTRVELAPGSTFAGYRIESEIGRGGMGVVYRATDLRLERPVALKLIAPELASDEEFRKRFLRESKLAASLGHPHILPVFSAGEEDGRLFLVMRYIDGGDLKALLAREGTLSPQRALAVLADVADALDGAHARGLVHRDVKPANVLLDEDGEAYLADFGLAKQTGGARRLLRRSRALTVAGTLVLVGAIAALVVALTTTGGGDAGLYPVVPNSVAAIDPETNRIVAAVPVGDGPTRVVAAKSGVWVMNRDAQTLSHVDPTTRELVRTFSVGVTPTDLAVDRNGLWVAGLDGSVSLVDPEQHTVVKRIKVRVFPNVLPNESRGIGQLASGFGSLWLSSGGRTVSRINPLTGKIVARVAGVETDVSLGGIAIGVGSVWVAGPYQLSPVTRIDPRTNTVLASIPLTKFRANGIEVGGGAVWVPDVGSDQVWRIDPAQNVGVGTTQVGTAPVDVAFGAGSVWVANSGDGTVSRIDPVSGRVAETIAVGGSPSGIAVADDTVWVTVD